MGEKRAVYRVLVGKPKGKRPLGRPRPRWENHIRMDLQEVGCGGIGTGDGTCDCGNELSGCIKCGELID